MKSRGEVLRRITTGSDVLSEDRAWYHDGLRFACARSGRCCSGTPGTVRVTDQEIETLARRLELPDPEFREIYTRRLRRGDISLREKRSGECIFFDPSGGCSVYPARPRQCRTWPFWASVVHSPERWAEAAAACPGMNRGPLRSAESIARRGANDGTSGKTRR